MTNFEYAVFISYRNSRFKENGLLSYFARQLNEALERIIDAYLYEDIGRENNNFMVFLDEKIIQGGDWIVREVSEGLCKSVCWVLVFTRNYLGGSLFCASELKGMIELQNHRKRQMNNALGESLIIPVLIRGDWGDMPNALKGIAMKSDFRRFTLAVKNLAEQPEFTEQLEFLADWIAQRQQTQCIKSSELGVDLCGNYATFRIEDVYTETGRQNVENFIKDLKKPDFPVI